MATLTSDPIKSAQFHAAQDYDRSYVIWIGPYTTTVGGNGGFYFTPNVSAILTGFAQIYVDGNSGSLTSVAVSSASASFPGGSFPLCYVALDAVGRIVSVISARGAPFAGQALNLYNGPA